jgi:hypothetical protein
VQPSCGGRKKESASSKKKKKKVAKTRFGLCLRFSALRLKKKNLFYRVDSSVLLAAKTVMCVRMQAN